MKQKPIIVKTEHVIDMDMLNDVIVSAIEGGSNYWYFIAEEAYKTIKKYQKDGKCFSESILPAILAGEKIDIHDLEEQDEVIGTISLETLQERLQKMADDCRPEISIIYQYSDDDYDANDADVIFQYLCMGEIVFG